MDAASIAPGLRQDTAKARLAHHEKLRASLFGAKGELLPAAVNAVRPLVELCASRDAPPGGRALAALLLAELARASLDRANPSSARVALKMSESLVGLGGALVAILRSLDPPARAGLGLAAARVGVAEDVFVSGLPKGALRSSLESAFLGRAPAFDEVLRSISPDLRAG